MFFVVYVCVFVLCMCFCCMACSLVVYGFLLLYICLMFLLYLGGHALVVCGMFLLYGMCISCTCLFF